MVVAIEDDFDLVKIAESGQCFRWEQIDNNIFRIIAFGRCLYIENLGEKLYRLDCTEEEFSDLWISYFDLTEDYEAIRLHINKEQDPFLWAAAEHEKGVRILRQDPWEVLVSFIISQNKNISAIKRSVELLSRAAGERMIDRCGREYYAFPTPEAIASMSEDALKGCSLGYRWKYVKAAAFSVISGELNLYGLMNEEAADAIRQLSSLYGVGVKVANCVSLYGLHHINAFPVDVWVRRILENEYPNGYSFEQYAPYNGIYQQYLFAYYREYYRKR